MAEPVASGRLDPRLLAGAAAILALGAGLLVWRASIYWPFLADDSLISLRYAERLLSGDGLTFTDGERVEGYSNLLWILLVSAVGLIEHDLIRAARLVNGSATLGILLVPVLWFRARGSRTWLLPAATAVLLLATTDALAIWTIGGLEQPLWVALLLASIASSVHAIGRDSPPTAWLATAGVLGGLACLTRPDTPVVIAALALAATAAAPPAARRRTFALLALVPLAFFAAQLAFRLAYYGDWIPNTARVKVALTPARIGLGLDYVGEGLATNAALALAAIASPLVLRRRDAAVLAAPLLAWTGYVVFIGGDIFAATRHLLLPLCGAALLVGLLVEELATRRRDLAAATAALALAGHAATQAHWHAPLKRTEQEFWVWQGEVIGGLVGRVFAEQQPLVAVTAAGCLPYFSKLPALDMLGLNDRYLATHPPEGFGTGFLGHELGDGAYVLSREPDIVFFCGPRGALKPCFPSGWQMMASPAFHEAYTLVRLQGRTPFDVLSLAWFRKDSPKVGVRTITEDEVLVPAWLLAKGDAVAALDETGALAAYLYPGAYALPAVHLPRPGLWCALPDGPSAPVVAAGLRRNEPMPATCLEIGEGQGLDVEVHVATSKNALLHAVRVVRRPG